MPGVPPASPLFVAADALTSLGDGIAATFTAMREGKTGVAPVQGFDPGPYACDAAARLAARPTYPVEEGSMRVVTPHGAVLEHVVRAAHRAARLEDLAPESV